MRLQTPLDVGEPVSLFRIPLLSSVSTTLTPAYDVAADGQRFLVITPVEGRVTPLTVVLNWAASAGR